MKVRNLLIGAAALLLALPPFLWAATTLRGVIVIQSSINTTGISTSAITNSTIDSSPIGASTPSSAAVTSLNVGTGTTIHQIIFYNTSVAFSAINAGTCGETTISGPANANAMIAINFLNYGSAFGVGSLNMNINASAPTTGNIFVVLCNTTTSAGLSYGGGAVPVNLLIVQ